MSERLAKGDDVMHFQIDAGPASFAVFVTALLAGVSVALKNLSTEALPFCGIYHAAVTALPIAVLSARLYAVLVVGSSLAVVPHRVLLQATSV